MNLSSVDLNLLVAFDALVAERSVTRAAKRLGLSQPAASNALRRLRDLLDDPVLVRAGSSMVPTERALELAPAVRDALSTVRRALSPPEFEPQTRSAVFHIATADMIEIHRSRRKVSVINAVASSSVRAQIKLLWLAPCR